MARYKEYDYRQGKFIPISFDKQILPGTFEHTLHYLIDNELDLSLFDARYCNDDTGAPAYDPAILLKIILYAYSRGITSSRKIEQLCRENIIFMALSADTQPHFTTIADFIATLDQEIIDLICVGGLAGNRWVYPEANRPRSGLWLTRGVVPLESKPCPVVIGCYISPYLMIESE